MLDAWTGPREQLDGSPSRSQLSSTTGSQNRPGLPTAIHSNTLAIYYGVRSPQMESYKRTSPMGRAGVYSSLRGRIGGLTRSASSDMRELAKSGAAGLAQRFVLQVDPDLVLDPSERRRRAEAARRLHFAKLALASAKARRRRKGQV